MRRSIRGSEFDAKQPVRPRRGVNVVEKGTVVVPEEGLHTRRAREPPAPSYSRQRRSSAWNPGPLAGTHDEEVEPALDGVYMGCTRARGLWRRGAPGRGAHAADGGRPPEQSSNRARSLHPDHRTCGVVDVAAGSEEGEQRTVDVTGRGVKRKMSVGTRWVRVGKARFASARPPSTGSPGGRARSSAIRPFWTRSKRRLAPTPRPPRHFKRPPPKPPVAERKVPTPLVDQKGRAVWLKGRPVDYPDPGATAYLRPLKARRQVEKKRA